MNRVRLTDKQLRAVVYAVETLCRFPLIETTSAIRTLCKLDSRIAKEVDEESQGSLRFIGLLKP